METESREIILRDSDWFVGWSLDVPGANGQGRAIEVCRASIAVAIELILEDKRLHGRH